METPLLLPNCLKLAITFIDEKDFYFMPHRSEDIQENNPGSATYLTVSIMET